MLINKTTTNRMPTYNSAFNGPNTNVVEAVEPVHRVDTAGGLRAGLATGAEQPLTLELGENCSSV